MKMETFITGMHALMIIGYATIGVLAVANRLIISGTASLVTSIAWLVLVWRINKEARNQPPDGIL